MFRFRQIKPEYQHLYDQTNEDGTLITSGVTQKMVDKAECIAELPTNEHSLNNTENKESGLKIMKIFNYEDEVQMNQSQE